MTIAGRSKLRLQLFDPDLEASVVALEPVVLSGKLCRKNALLAQQGLQIKPGSQSTWP